MGVYIKGMKMPETCETCDFCIWSNYHQTGWCRQEQRQCFDDCSVEYREKRAEFCPMTELHPHGRLIDADALAKEIEYARFYHSHTDGLTTRHHVAEYGHFLNALSEFPTIIPADPSKEGGG